MTIEEMESLLKEGTFTELVSGRNYLLVLPTTSRADFKMIKHFREKVLNDFNAKVVVIKDDGVRIFEIKETSDDETNQERQ